MRVIVTLSQTLVYILVRPLFRFFFRVKSKHSSETFENIRKGRSLIMIANHASRLDPFVILSSFTFRTFYKLLPIRFMIASNYMNTPLQKLFLIPLGCFPHKTSDESYSSIEKSIEFLERGERVFIFPEGKRVKARENTEPKRGIGVIAQRTNYPTIPIHLSGAEYLNLADILTRQVNTVVSTGDIISNQTAKAISEDPSLIAKELMKKIYELE